MYAGLTTADKGALLDAKARGAEWVARDTNNDLYGYAVEPIDDVNYGWTIPFIGNVITINSELMKFVLHHEKVNIDLALAQIAKMELTTNSTPLTWNERINQMGINERAFLSAGFAYVVERSRKWAVSKYKFKPWKIQDAMAEYMRKFLHSPYTEGATK